MKNLTKYLFVVSFLALTIYGCKKGITPVQVPVQDTTNPTISILKPTAGQSFVAGNTISIQATFSDNVNLKSYEIAISKVVSGGLTLKIVPTSKPYSYAKSSTSFGPGVKQQEINLSDILIPSNTVTTIVTPGKYNLKVTCIDGSNNSSETTLEININ